MPENPIRQNRSVIETTFQNTTTNSLRLPALLGIFLAFITTASFASQPAFLSQNPRSISSNDEIAVLIEQLDSGNFGEREQAATRLIQIGEPVIGPLAMKSFECSPESCWRIKKTLEQICTTGSETVFYKTTGILQIRFDTGNAEMKQRLSKLKSQWKMQRKKEAISRLRKLGAKIVDPWEGVAQPDQVAAQQMIQLGPGHFVIVNGELVEVESSSTKVTKQTGRKIAVSDQDQKTQIKKILDSDLKQVRKLVLGSEKEADHQKQKESIEYQRQLMRRALFAPGAVGTSGGVTVELGKKWKGKPTELEDLAVISNLKELKLSELDLSDKLIGAVSSVPTISKLIIEQCQVDSRGIKNAKWPQTLAEIELGKIKIETELIDSFRALPMLQTLTFNDCDLKGVGFSSLKKFNTLRGLQLKDSKIPKEFFKAVQGMSQLSYLNFSTCRFNTEDYNELKLKRDKLQITYTAQAFLGVQGPMELTGVPSDVPCVVAEVIPDSGAEKGGLKPNDLIKAVDGDAVKFFEDLRLQIAQHYPGDTLSLDVTRNGKKLKLKVTLTGRMTGR